MNTGMTIAKHVGTVSTRQNVVIPPMHSYRSEFKHGGFHMVNGWPVIDEPRNPMRGGVGPRDEDLRAETYAEPRGFYALRDLFAAGHGKRNWVGCGTASDPNYQP